jgi:PAS domain S-box-containing protein
MVHGLELFFALFNNLALFIALVALYRHIFGQFKNTRWLNRQILLGFAFGLFAIGCMHAKIPVFQGVLVDQRNAVVALSGAFGGPLAAALSALFAAAYRAHLGGEGVLAGVIGLCLAASAGTALHLARGSFASPRRAAASSLFATLVILPGFLFIGDLRTGLGLMEAMALPYGTAIFCGIFLVGLLLNREEELYKVEQSFLASEEKYRELVEGTDDLIIRTDPEGRLTFANNVSRKFLGLSPEECLGKRLVEFVHPEDRERTWAWRTECAEARREQCQIENRMVNAANGEARSIMWSASFRYDAEGTLRSVGGIARDITERRNAEAKLLQSEDKFSRLFRLSPDSVVLVDLTTGKIVDVNETFLHSTGYAREEVLGRSGDELHLMADPDRTRTMTDILRREGKLENFEFEGVRKDGVVQICSMSAQILDIDGRPHQISIVREITDLKKMQEMMVQTEKMLSVGGIAAGIAHEINNPLGIVLQATQNLARRTDPELPKNIEIARAIGLDMNLLAAYMRERNLDTYIEDIKFAAIRASGIIRHMLDFSRRSESKRTVCDLPGLVHKALDLAQSDYDLKKSYDFKKIHIDLTIGDDLPPINCTETEIEQVLLNLLRNSAQAMADSAPPVAAPRIDIRLSALPQGVRIEVEDNGPGIPPATQRRIFEPFFTTKGPGVGTGLGLSVSYFIVTKGHGGRMTVESTPGAGTRFIIDLPTEEARD